MCIHLSLSFFVNSQNYLLNDQPPLPVTLYERILTIYFKSSKTIFFSPVIHLSKGNNSDMYKYLMYTDVHQVFSVIAKIKQYPCDKIYINLNTLRRLFNI